MSESTEGKSLTAEGEPGIKELPAKPSLTNVEGKVSVEFIFRFKLEPESLVQFVEDMEGWLDDVILDYLSEHESEIYIKHDLELNKDQLQRIELVKPFAALIRE